MESSTIFFRIDDIGDPKGDQEYLHPLLDIFVEQQIPFNLQLIPAKLSDKTVVFLEKLLKQYPYLIELDQHGFSHDLQEFYPGSSYKEQRALIEKGLKIIQDGFGIQPIAFTPPEHIYTKDTILALNDLGFKVFSKHIRCSVSGEIFYLLGRALRRHWIFKKKVSYHMLRLPSTQLVELSIVIESIKNGGRVKNKEEFQVEYDHCSRFTPICGVLLHPIHFCTKEYLLNMKSILEFVKKSRIRCMRFEDILRALNR